MSTDSESEPGPLENAEEVIEELAKELQELYAFRDLFFENHTIEQAKDKNYLVDEKKNILAKKFEKIDVNLQVPQHLRARFLYLKGRCYNISPVHSPRALECLSRAVKLNPQYVDAWNELGECFWKNMKIKEAKSSFEGALKHERHRLSLRCLSIILRQESGSKNREEAAPVIVNSVELAKEAVAQDIKDGVSWGVLGNAYLCRFFMVQQDPATLKLCMSAYKQAELDPIARGQPDLYYNRGIALKYEECYQEALDSFEYACRLDPPWDLPRQELVKLEQYLNCVDVLVKTKGKVKPRRVQHLVQSIDKKKLGVYKPGSLHTFGSRKDVALKLTRLDELDIGNNDGKLVLGRVVGSIHNEGAVPFTFALVDESMQCVSVTVYNWADGRGVAIGDCVAIPEPKYSRHTLHSDSLNVDFKSIRVNNPMLLLVNGKRVGRNQFATTKVTSTYEIH